MSRCMGVSQAVIRGRATVMAEKKVNSTYMFCPQASDKVLKKGNGKVKPSVLCIRALGTPNCLHETEHIQSQGSI